MTDDTADDLANDFAARLAVLVARIAALEVRVTQLEALACFSIPTRRLRALGCGCPAEVLPEHCSWALCPRRR